MLWTLTEATEFYNRAKTAYLAAIDGKSYAIGTGGTSRNLTRQEIDTLEQRMMYWKKYVDDLGNTNPNRGNRIKFIKPNK